MCDNNSNQYAALEEVRTVIGDEDINALLKDDWIILNTQLVVVTEEVFKGPEQKAVPYALMGRQFKPKLPPRWEIPKGKPIE